MSRIAAVLLLGGVALLVSWAIAPAESVSSSTADQLQASADQAAAIVADVNGQVDRMRARLAIASAERRPVRNPFHFGAEPARRPEETSVPVAPAGDSPALVLPRLLAIIGSPASGVGSRSVAVALGEEVLVVNVGDAVGPFVVKAIDESGADLVDGSGLKVYRITLL